jgi:dTMP kinase
MTRLARGVLVAFEGIDGSGKTTQADLLARYLYKHNIDMLATKEPTSGAWGRKIKDSKMTGRLDVADELRYFIEDRKEHVANEICPALERGAVVIVDRYYYSTVAYQGARGINPQKLLDANRAFAPTPDLTVLLDIDPQMGLIRIYQRGSRQDAFEDLDNLIKARAIFRELKEPHILNLNAELPIDRIHTMVLDRLFEGPVGDFLGAPGESKSPLTPPGDRDRRL